MNEKRLHVIMPMAGKGSRFEARGFKLPKPLILIDNIPMYQHSLNSIINKNFKLTCIVKKEHDQKYDISQNILNFHPNANVVALSEDTNGPVETCYKALSNVEENDALIVLDCDLWFESKEYFSIIDSVLKNKNNVDGLLLTFQSNKPFYSYAKIENGIVCKTSEKKVISSNAIAGAYFFSSKKLFFDAATIELGKNITNSNKEYYVSSLYNHIIKKSGLVRNATIEKYKSFGTPNDLEENTFD